MEQAQAEQGPVEQQLLLHTAWRQGRAGPPELCGPAELTGLLEPGQEQSPCLPLPGLLCHSSSSSNSGSGDGNTFFKSNVAWKSLLQQLPLKPIVSSAPLTCQILAAADGANTPWRAAIQFKDHLPCTDSLRAGPSPDFTKSRRESQGAV